MKTRRLGEIKQILGKLKEELKAQYKVKEIGLFGSYVRYQQKESSDIDILVEFEKPVSLLHIVSLENYLSDILKIKVDIVPKNNIRQELKADILKETVPV